MLGLALVVATAPTGAALPAPSPGGAATPVPPTLAGLYVDAPGRAGDPEFLDGWLRICPGGLATYVVIDNQLVYTFRVRPAARGDGLDFYYDGGDHGRGFMDARLHEPAPGARVATARATASQRLALDWHDRAFARAVRRASPPDMHLHPFPRVFYAATRVAEPLQGCDP